MAERGEPTLRQAEWTVLALLAERSSHGWALAAAVEPGTEIGEIWAGSRQRVYRALQTLAEHDLVEAFAIEPAGGPHKVVYRPTDGGREELARWLAEPVDHVREMNSTFLLKVAFLVRADASPVPLLNTQRALFAVAAATLRHQLTGREPGELLHLRLRLATTEAVLEFIDETCNAFARRPLAGRPRATASRRKSA